MPEPPRKRKRDPERATEIGRRLDMLAPHFPAEFGALRSGNLTKAELDRIAGEVVKDGALI